jgi:hypothetical protein
LVSLAALFQFAAIDRASSENDVTVIDAAKDENTVRTTNSVKNKQRRRHQYQMTHICVSFCAFAWSFFLARTILVAVASSGILVEEPGE